MKYIDADGTVHYVIGSMRPGSALCGTPPHRVKTGRPWLSTDPAGDIYRGSMPVDCPACIPAGRR